MEKALAKEFIPALFPFPANETDKIRNLLALPVKRGGLGIRDPTKTATKSHEASEQGVEPVIMALKTNEPLDVSAYRKHCAHVRSKGKADREKEDVAQFKTELGTMGGMAKRVISRAPDTGAWLSAIPTHANGSVLTPDEFRDPLWLRYNFRPRHLPRRCDACNCPFDVRHALKCAKA